MAGRIERPHGPDRARHDGAEMSRFRARAIAATQPGAKGCGLLRQDPVSRMAVGRLPETGGKLCSQPTMTRPENLPGPAGLKRMIMMGTVALFCGGLDSMLRQIESDIGGTEDRPIAPPPSSTTGNRSIRRPRLPPRPSDFQNKRSKLMADTHMPSCLISLPPLSAGQNTDDSSNLISQKPSTFDINNGGMSKIS